MIGLILISTLFLLVFAAIFFMRGYFKWREWSRLRSGVLITATIIRHHPELYMFNSVENQTPQRYEVTYRYEYEGKTYRNTQPVSRKLYQRWSDGDTVHVLCLADDPNKSILDEDTTYRKQKSSEARRLFAYSVLTVAVLLLGYYLLVLFTK